MDVHQIRIYEIFEHNKEYFHDRFKDHAARIMRHHGFIFMAMWEVQTPARTEFAYLLRWPSIAIKEASWSAFMADEEWTEIKRVTSAVHGRLVGSIEDRILMPTSYSPALA